MNLRLNRFRFSAMGCPCEVALYAERSRRAERWFHLARREVQRLDRKYSHYRPDSELARIRE